MVELPDINLNLESAWDGFWYLIETLIDTSASVFQSLFLTVRSYVSSHFLMTIVLIVAMAMYVMVKRKVI